MTCHLDGCTRKVRSLKSGVCHTHYERKRRTGTYGLKTTAETLPTNPILEYANRVEVENVSGLIGWNEQVSVAKADEIACNLLGVHPCMIYGDEWFTADVAA